MIEAKEVIANWILNRSEDSQEEIVNLLDKAYPEGSQERLVFDWGEIIGYSYKFGSNPIDNIIEEDSNALRIQARLCCLNGILTGKEKDSG